MKYKLKIKNFEIWKHDIYLIPTFRIMIDNMMYTEKNFSIEFHFLILHGRLLFMKEVQYESCL